MARIVEGYKPLKYKVAFCAVREHIPRGSLKQIDWLRAELISIKSSLKLPITYSDMRFSLTPEGKKQADMAFITYFVQKHDRDAQNAPRTARLHYLWLRLCYFPELSYVNGRPDTTETKNYSKQWGYMQSINPSFVELIRGTDVDSALFAIENLN